MPDATTIGKWIMIAGAGLLVLGGLIWVVGRAGFPLGRLPGDLRIERDGFSFYFPLASSIIVSIALTLLLNLLARLLKR
ncbi:MAG: DUF2905 domain-containing protein [Chloroflexi bacterium]|nr:DUF2905 domain-containing protein [Chloroflexota bacterium]